MEPSNQNECELRHNFITQSEIMAAKLLDLTGRNPLIHTNLKSGKSRSATRLRIINNTLGEIYESVISEKPIGFLPIPEPTNLPKDESTSEFEFELDKAKEIDAEYIERIRQLGEEFTDKQIDNAERKLRDKVRLKLGMCSFDSAKLADISKQAKEAGVNPSFELNYEATREQRNLRNLQTLKYPEDLDRSLRNIFSQAKLRESETGLNFLSLAFGYLEWYSSSSSEKPFLSPVVLVQVRIQKNEENGLKEFKLVVDEEAQLNLCLKEKLKREFNIVLPDFDSEMDVEDYLKNINDLIRNKQGWAIHHFCVLGFYSFAKLVMYKDLKNPIWGEQSRTHPLLKQLFGNVSDSGFGSSETYDVDQPYVRALIPALPRAADASQMSAIVDVLTGVDLSLQGPPGTGKSQTISNLIAAALYLGKSVLFVAEKRAALEVVKSRLDDVGLGELCLELHSAKTKKSEIAKKLVSQSRDLGRHTHQANQNKTVFENLAGIIDQLNERYKKIHLPNDNEEFSVYELIGKFVDMQLRYEELSKLDTDIQIPNDVVENTKNKKKILDIVETAKNSFLKLTITSNTEKHPWLFFLRNAETEKDKDLIVNEFIQVERFLNESGDIFSSVELTRDKYGAIRMAELECLNFMLELDELLVQNSKMVEYLNDKTNTIKAREFISSCEVRDLMRRKIENNFSIPIRNISEQNYSELQDVYNVVCSNGLEGVNREVLEEERIKLNRNIDSLSKVSGILEDALRIVPIDNIEMSAPDISTVQIAIMLANEYSDLGLSDNYNLEALSKIGIATKMQELSKQAALLKAEREKLKRIFIFERLPGTDVVKSLLFNFQCASVFWWMGTNGIKDFRTLNAIRFNAVWPKSKRSIEELTVLLKYIEDVERFNRSESVLESLGVKWEGIDTNFTPHLECSLWCLKVRRVMPTTELGITFSNLLFGEEQNKRIALGNLIRSEKYAHIEKVLNLLEEEAAGAAHSISVLKQVSMTRMEKLKKILNSLGKVLYPEKMPLKRLSELLKLMLELKCAEEKIVEWYKESQSFGVDEGEYSSLKNVVAVLKYLEVVNESQVGDERKNLLKRENGPGLFLEYRQMCMLKEDPINKLIMFWKKYFSSLPPSYKNEIDAFTFERFSEYVKKALELIDEADWALDYKVAEKQLQRFLPGRLFSHFRKAEISWDLSAVSVEYLWLKSMVMSMGGKYVNELQLGERLVSELKTLDEHSKKEIVSLLLSKRRNAFVPRGINGPLVGDKTELALLRHEASKSKRHFEIRELCKKSSKAIKAIKPCFMMSPMSVATYLPPEISRFDLIIMDEASQIKTEDALGAILRGNQLLVVGDPKQLPPTSFFWQSNSSDDGEEDENDNLRGVESVLDFCWEKLPKRRSLLWHYRSQHHSLIAFSNKWFYNNELFIAPSSSADASDLGVKHIYVGDHVYEAQKNLREAEEVLKVVREHVKIHSDKSLGVVAINQAQSQLLEDMFALEENTNLRFKDFINKWESENQSFFVKNLENVQGDERDVIVVSTVYGKDSEGNFHRRFGPINTVGGERRLNVLFTRAKRSTIVVTSIDTTKLVDDSSAMNAGSRILKEYLEYAKTGVLSGDRDSHSGREPDSEFEMAVINMLRKQGYDCVPQFDVARYFIDIAVRDPNKPGRYLCGIECDGAMYHSYRSARDRDKLRQEVLENLGWDIYRIWSTDWFQDMNGQKKKLLEYLDTLVKRSRQEDERRLGMK